MQKTVSVIIPVYNAEKYLVECLGNVVNQTLSDMEIILVNDASTDNSLALMKECEKQFPDKVKVIDLPVNSGAGGARNEGIKLATGEYIGFVDSDDLIEVEMYRKLYQKAKEGDYDVVDAGYYKQSEDLAIVHTSDDLTGELDNEKRKALIVSGGYLVSKIFRRELFDDEKMQFRKNVILEDSDILTYLFSKIKTIGNVKEVLYFYRDNQSSSSNEVDVEKYYHNIYEAIQGIYQKLHDVPNYEEIREAVEYEMIRFYSFGINVCVQAYLRRQKEGLLKKLLRLGELREKTISPGYQNAYVQAKIESMDISFMKYNDEEPEKIFRLLDKHMGGL